MVPATKLVYDTRRKLDATNGTGSEGDIPLVDYIAAINEAQEIWFTNLVQVAETNGRVRDDLSIFEVKKAELPIEEVDGKCVRAKLPDDYYKRLNQVAKATNDCCEGEEKEIIIRMNRSDDINETLQNPYRRANFPYEQLNGDEAGNYLYVYHQGEMDVKSVCIDYYRRPNPIHAPSLSTCSTDQGTYYDYEGQAITEDSGFEACNRFADQRVSSIAALLLSEFRGDYNKFQVKLNGILALNTLYQN